MSETPSDDVVDALSRLEEQVSALQGEVRRLGSVSSLPTPADDLPPPPAAYAWLGALQAPTRRRPGCRDSYSKGLFLGAVAAAAAIAELDAVAIAGVMIGAWVIVALIEWAASRAEGRHEIMSYAPAAPAAGRRGPGLVQPSGRADAARRPRDRLGDRGDAAPPGARRRRVDCQSARRSPRRADCGRISGGP